MRTTRRRRGILSRAVALFATVCAFGGCAEQTEPLPAPIVARPFGGDSLQPGSKVIVCKPDDVACVPTYAVACEVIWMGDSTQLGQAVVPPLSPEERAWCVAQPHEPSKQTQPLRESRFTKPPRAARDPP
jgi:hypothetical protein